jgi:hypothetical protein
MAVQDGFEIIRTENDTKHFISVGQEDNDQRKI